MLIFFLYFGGEDNFGHLRLFFWFNDARCVFGKSFTLLNQHDTFVSLIIEICEHISLILMSVVE